MTLYLFMTPPVPPRPDVPRLPPPPLPWARRRFEGPWSWSQDRTAGCPCRPENGGSGICGCVLNNTISMRI